MKEEKVNIRNLFWYFIIFSIIGLIIETVFCYVTTGIIESRKGLIWGPFCPIYGLGASILIYFLDKYKNSDIKVFIYGGILGGAIEYILSFAMEAMYSSRFWNYDHLPFNLNGRICGTYTLYWAFLAIILMKYIRPKLDEFLNKMSKKKKSVLEKGLVIFLTIDCLVTVWGVTVYKNRAINAYKNKPETEKEDNIISQIEDNYFSNERMKWIFPNLRIKDENGKELFIRDILK